MRRKVFVTVGALAVAGVAIAVVLFVIYPVQFLIFGALMRNYFLTWSTPQGMTTLEVNAAYKAPQTLAPSTAAESAMPGVTGGDWPSYNRTLTSERFAPLSEINTQNTSKLKVLCTYDTGSFTAFESGLIM